MDIYPTLIDLCGLPPRKLEGNSLVPLLKNPQAKWDHPALTTHGRNNHTIRTEKWRYIRYANGDEELYDHDNDPHEWKNLAKDARYGNVKKELPQYLPKVNAPDAPTAKGDGQKKKKKADDASLSISGQVRAYLPQNLSTPFGGPVMMRWNSPDRLMRPLMWENLERRRLPWN